MGVNFTIPFAFLKKNNKSIFTVNFKILNSRRKFSAKLYIKCRRYYNIIYCMNYLIPLSIFQLSLT